MPDPCPSLPRLFVTPAVGVGLAPAVDARVQFRPLAREPLPTDRNSSFNVTSGNVPVDGDNRHDLFVGDVDGDKDPDVLLGNHGGRNDVHVNVDTVK